MRLQVNAYQGPVAVLQSRELSRTGCVRLGNEPRAADWWERGKIGKEEG